MPLINLDAKIVETQREFDLYELRNWEFQRFQDPNGDFYLWESFFPQFVFPQSHHFPEFAVWC